MHILTFLLISLAIILMKHYTLPKPALKESQKWKIHHHYSFYPFYFRKHEWLSLYATNSAIQFYIYLIKNPHFWTLLLGKQCGSFLFNCCKDNLSFYLFLTVISIKSWKSSAKRTWRTFGQFQYLFSKVALEIYTDYIVIQCERKSNFIANVFKHIYLF